VRLRLLLVAVQGVIVEVLAMDAQLVVLVVLLMTGRLLVRFLGLNLGIDGIVQKQMGRTQVLLLMWLQGSQRRS
jgi:hypothetical protein